MVFVETATFECDGCGTCAPSTRIDYDRLGYPICPACGRTRGPLARRVRPRDHGVERDRRRAVR